MFQSWNLHGKKAFERVTTLSFHFEKILQYDLGPGYSYKGDSGNRVWNDAERSQEMPRVCSNWMGQGTRNEPPDLLVLPKVKCYVWFSSDGNSCSSLELSLNDTSSGLSWQTLSPLSLLRHSVETLSHWVPLLHSSSSWFVSKTLNRITKLLVNIYCRKEEQPPNCIGDNPVSSWDSKPVTRLAKP